MSLEKGASFQFRQGCTSLWSPGEGDCWGGQSRHGHSHTTVVPDEATKKICKAEELLELLNRCRCGPIHFCLDLFWVCPHSLFQ